MTHTYNVSGMTCTGCQAKVQGLLSAVEGVKKVNIDLAKAEASIDMDRHISTSALQEALKNYPKYQLKEAGHQQHHENDTAAEESKSWLATYKPILLVFSYILGVSLLLESYSGNFLWARWMNHFMAGFFLVFSFFKLLDLRAFADSYSSYDVLAKKWNAWGFLYPFVELMLGIFYLVNIYPLLTNAITFVVMSVSIIGVLQSVLNKKKIRCACLGAVFNLPMSTITILEDALMIVMSAIMLALMW